MTRPIEAVVAEAQQRLESTGRLEVTAYVSAYPEHATELSELLPIMLTLHQEKRWKAAEEASRTFAMSLFAELSAPAQTREATLGDLFTLERAEAGLSLEEQARRSGLPATSLESISRDVTPLAGLDNAGIKQVAARAAAPFAALVKEVRRLTSLLSLDSMQGGAVFTRDKETSTTDELQALRDRVRHAVRKPPEEP
jgi:hypothetical protein